MKIGVVDSTLREGWQSCHELFARNDPVDYVGFASSLGIAERFETYLPGGPYISHSQWGDLLGQHATRLQAYVGPIHNFDENEARRVRDLSNWPMLSTTLVFTDMDYRDRLRRLYDMSNGSPVRVGVECAASRSITEAVDIVSTLADMAEVDVVSVNDSNGMMTENWVDSFFKKIHPSDLGKTTLGFHIHNGRCGMEATAKSKMRHIVQRVGGLGLWDRIEVDATIGGVGDGLGLLSIEDAGEIRGGGVVPEDAILSLRSLVNSRAFNITYANAAKSHYDMEGNLRLEYS